MLQAELPKHPLFVPMLELNIFLVKLGILRASDLDRIEKEMPFMESMAGKHLLLYDFMGQFSFAHLKPFFFDPLCGGVG